MERRPYGNHGQLRQWGTIERVADRVARVDEFLGLLLIGSFAAGTADPLSDVDLIVVVRDGAFDHAWARRRELGGPSDVAVWDVRSASPDVGAHKFITADLVYVECLLATPASSARLAPPYEVLTGDSDLPHRLIRRPLIDRSELRAGSGVELDDPGAEIDRTYGRFIAAVRARPAGDD